MPDKITLSLPEQYRQFAPTVWPSVAESARADGYHWIAEQIEAQLPKAPVEEPTEFGSVIRATLPVDTADPGAGWNGLWLCERDAMWASDQSSLYVKFSQLTDVEVLRVGVGEPAPEQVEAEAAPVGGFETLLAAPYEQFDKRSEILASIEAYSKAVPTTASVPEWARATPPPAEAVEADEVCRHESDHYLMEACGSCGYGVPEPGAEQVEADLAQDEQARARYYAQPGVPVEKVLALVAEFTRKAAHSDRPLTLRIAWSNAASDLAALLPKEPTS